jgi:hypothetical protein
MYLAACDKPVQACVVGLFNKRCDRHNCRDGTANNESWHSHRARRAEISATAVDAVRGIAAGNLGLAIESAASAGITQLIRSMLYDTRPLDPSVYIAVIFTLLMVATLACMMPARLAIEPDACAAG